MEVQLHTSESESINSFNVNVEKGLVLESTTKPPNLLVNQDIAKSFNKYNNDSSVKTW